MERGLAEDGSMITLTQENGRGKHTHTQTWSRKQTFGYRSGPVPRLHHTVGGEWGRRPLWVIETHTTTEAGVHLVQDCSILQPHIHKLWTTQTHQCGALKCLAPHCFSTLAEYQMVSLALQTKQINTDQSDPIHSHLHKCSGEIAPSFVYNSAVLGIHIHVVVFSSLHLDLINTAVYLIANVLWVLCSQALQMPII